MNICSPPVVLDTYVPVSNVFLSAVIGAFALLNELVLDATAYLTPVVLNSVMEYDGRFVVSVGTPTVIVVLATNPIVLNTRNTVGGAFTAVANCIRVNDPNCIELSATTDGVPFAVVALFPFPDLSLQAVTDDVPVIVDESAASNHSCNPGIDWGENPHVVLDDDTIDVAIALLI